MRVLQLIPPRPSYWIVHVTRATFPNKTLPSSHRLLHRGDDGLYGGRIFSVRRHVAHPANRTATEIVESF